MYSRPNKYTNKLYIVYAQDIKLNCEAQILDTLHRLTHLPMYSVVRVTISISIIILIVLFHQKNAYSR